MKNKELRAWIVLLAMQLVWIGPCVYDANARVPKEEVIKETEDIIRWKQEEVSIEEVEVETVTEPIEETVFYNVPLSEQLQLHIFEECEKHNIAPAIVIALIERESDFDEYAESSKGAKGLMQVVPKWHGERMDRLDCGDLFNPYQNITVGIDYLAELKEKNSDLYWVLMAYNQGMSKATVRLANEDYSNYAISIVERASELTKEVEDATK